MTYEEWEQLAKGAARIWAEDDAAPDAERVDAALKRIWPWGNFRDSLHFIDYGDAVLHFYRYGPAIVIVQRSYRGNGAIYVAKAGN